MYCQICDITSSLLVSPISSSVSLSCGSLVSWFHRYILYTNKHTHMQARMTLWSMAARCGSQTELRRTGCAFLPTPAKDLLTRTSLSSACPWKAKGYVENETNFLNRCQSLPYIKAAMLKWHLFPQLRNEFRCSSIELFFSQTNYKKLVLLQIS